MSKNCIIVKMVSTDPNSSYFYTTTINKKSMGDKKLNLRGYDPTLRKYVLFKQEKIK